jgi:hypothetical protein
VSEEQEIGQEPGGAMEPKLPLQPGGIVAAERGGMLPGIAGICMFFLLLAMLNAFAAIRGVYGSKGVSYSVLGVCSLLILGVFGLLRLKRWGWALVVGGALLMSFGDLYFYLHAHQGFFVVRALFELCFFLYLVRTEVRERLR